MEWSSVTPWSPPTIETTAGTEAQKRRAATELFNFIVETARLLGIMNSSQLLEDRRTEALWLAKECRIRTANYLMLTDCAFLFFRGLPLRIWDPEIECDLPCPENVFDAEHPFTHADFSFKRPLTTQQAFSAMFDTRHSTSRSILALTMLDSFVLIHMLYRFANSALTIQLSRATATPEPHGSYSAIIAEIRGALDFWFGEWTRLQKLAVSTGEWDALGFYRNGDQYAYTTLLLLSSKAGLQLRQLLRPNVYCLSLLREMNR